VPVASCFSMFLIICPPGLPSLLLGVRAPVVLHQPAGGGAARVIDAMAALVPESSTILSPPGRHG
jgi:hypothetical protein